MNPHTCHSQPFQFGHTHHHLSREQSRFFDQIQLDFSHQIVRELAPLLGSRVEMEPRSRERILFHLYLAALNPPAPTVIFALEEEVSGMICFDFELAHGLFTEMLGGQTGLYLPRRFSDLERAMLRLPLSRILKAYNEAWSPVYDLEASMESLEMNPYSVLICPPSERMLVTSFHLSLGHCEGRMDVCLPLKALKRRLPKTSFTEHMLRRDSDWDARAHHHSGLEGTVKNAIVTVSALLGTAEIPFQELLEVEVGDIVRLETETLAPLEIRVNGTPRFLARPGVSKGRMAARVSETLS